MGASEFSQGSRNQIHLLIDWWWILRLRSPYMIVTAERTGCGPVVEAEIAMSSDCGIIFNLHLTLKSNNWDELVARIGQYLP